MLKLVVLVSGGGTNLQAIIDGIADGSIPNTEIKAVISNNKNAYALQRAKDHNIAAACVSPKDFADRAAFNQALLEKIKSYEPDLIVLAGCLVVVPEIMDRIQYRQTYCLKQGFLSCGFQAVHNVHFLCRKTHRAASQNPQPGDKSAQNNSPEYCWSFPQKDFPVLRSHPRIHDQIHEEKASPALGMSQDFFHYKHCGRLYNKPALPHGHLL